MARDVNRRDIFFSHSLFVSLLLLFLPLTLLSLDENIHTIRGLRLYFESRIVEFLGFFDYSKVSFCGFSLLQTCSFGQHVGVDVEDFKYL